MTSVNKVILVGRLGQDPELKYTQSGQPVCNLSVATSEVWNDKNGQRQEKTEWHRVIVWGKPAENCAKYLGKGRLVYLEGRNETRSWEDKNSGEKRYATEVVANTVQFLDKAPEGQGAPRDPRYTPEQKSARREQQMDIRVQNTREPHMPPPAGPIDYEDIPF